MIGDEALKYTVVLPVVAEVMRTLLALMPAELARPNVSAAPTEQAPLRDRVDTEMAGDKALLEVMICGSAEREGVGEGVVEGETVQLGETEPVRVRVLLRVDDTLAVGVKLRVRLAEAVEKTVLDADDENDAVLLALNDALALNDDKTELLSEKEGDGVALPVSVGLKLTDADEVADGEILGDDDIDDDSVDETVPLVLGDALEENDGDTVEDHDTV